VARHQGKLCCMSVGSVDFFFVFADSSPRQSCRVFSAIAIKTASAVHNSVRGGSLKRTGWGALLRTLLRWVLHVIHHLLACGECPSSVSQMRSRLNFLDESRANPYPQSTPETRRYTQMWRSCLQHVEKQPALSHRILYSRIPSRLTS